MKIRIHSLCRLLGLLLVVLVQEQARAVLVTVAYPGRLSSPTAQINLSTATPATLSFDVSSLPAGVVIQTAILRLIPVATPGVSRKSDQQVRIFEAGQTDRSIGQLFLPPDVDFVESDHKRLPPGKGLAGSLEKQRPPATGPYSLDLKTDNTSQSYWADNAPVEQNRPRLIVTWDDQTKAVMRTGAQLRYSGNPSDQSPWRNNPPTNPPDQPLLQDPPTGAMVSDLAAGLAISVITAGPVFHNDEILLVAVSVDFQKPTLYAIDWNGKKRWEYTLPPLPSTGAWKYLSMAGPDRLLVFGNSYGIQVLELFTASGPTRSFNTSIPGLTLTYRPQVSAGGMVSFSYLNDDGFTLYTLGPVSQSPPAPAPGLPPPVLWKYLLPANDQVNAALGISPPGGDGLVYQIGPSGLAVFDAARGTPCFPVPTVPPSFPKNSTLAQCTPFQPLAVFGQSPDLVCLTATGAAIEGYNAFTKGDPSGWKTPAKTSLSGLVAPRKADGSNPDSIYGVQGGQLTKLNLLGAQTAVSSASTPPNPGAPVSRPRGASSAPPSGVRVSSNLVADGGGNIYFWDGTAGNPVFYGFDMNCNPLFAQQRLPALTSGSEFVVGPNGVIYVTTEKANSRNLWAIQPTRADSTVPSLTANTRYTAAGPLQYTTAALAPTDGPVILTAGDSLSLGQLQIPAGANVTCSAATSIKFGDGFAVRAGGTLRCGLAPAPLTGN